MYDTYASRIKVFDIEIPSSVRAVRQAIKETVFMNMILKGRWHLPIQH